MSTHNTPVEPVVEDQPVVVVAPRPGPARLPDELILMVIEWCNALVKDRLKTLSALGRLNKRFKSDVERHLYSRVALSDELADVSAAAGAMRDVLVRRPSLRRLVQAVDLSSARRRRWMAGDYRIAQVLEDLPAVSDITCRGDWVKFAEVILSNHVLQIRRFEAYDVGYLDTFSLVGVNRAAFATLQSLSLSSADVLWDLQHFDVGHDIKTLELITLGGDHELDPLTSAFADNLTRLTLPVSAGLAACNPALYPSLLHLSLSSDDIDVVAVRQAISGVVTFLAAAAQLASLVSLEWHCTSAPPDDGGPGNKLAVTLVAPSPVTNAILAAVPRQSRHLSLVTNCFAPADVTAYLSDDAQRPSQLATLRIGGPLGRGLGRILYGEVEVEGVEGLCGALAGVLERAGVEVTTVE
ncbi:hypothetical protein JCM8208_005281 [Rhodotorula glutinis]